MSPALSIFRLLAIAVAALGLHAAELAPNGARQPDDPDGDQWVRPAKNFASTRFSPLDQIRVDNVKNLKVAWTFSTGVDRGHEAAPIVVRDTMFIVTPFPNNVYALD